MNYLVGRFCQGVLLIPRVNVLLKIGNPFIGGILGHSGITHLHDVCAAAVHKHLGNLGICILQRRGNDVNGNI